MSVTDDLTSFEKDLQARNLLDKAREICAPFGLRPDDLRRSSKTRRMAPPIVAEARARFARHLHEQCQWSYAMIGDFMGYKNRHMVFYLIGAGAGQKNESARRRAARFADKGKP